MFQVLYFDRHKQSYSKKLSLGDFIVMTLVSEELQLFHLFCSWETFIESVFHALFFYILNQRNNKNLTHLSSGDFVDMTLVSGGPF